MPTRTDPRLEHETRMIVDGAETSRDRRHAHHDHAGRVIHQAPTFRPVFAAHERDHHITTSGRRALGRSQFALPPGPEQVRRGIAGRLPIDTLARARDALARASMMFNRGHISAGELAKARRAVHAAWPTIGHAKPTGKRRGRSHR